MNKVYTAQEVADKLKIKKSTVYDLIKRGELPSPKSVNNCGSARNSCLSILIVRNVLPLLFSLTIISRKVLF